jgi:short-subunit dehydrogenase
MRENRSGKIVNITSMGGKIHTPLGAWYHATKFALEAISDCLRLELKPFGIEVIVIEPGGIKTEWAGIAADKVRAVSSDGPYAPQRNAVANSLSSESSQRRSSPPELIARTITKAVQVGKPRTRYAVGFGGKPMIFLHDVLPDRTFDTFMRCTGGVLSNYPASASNTARASVGNGPLPGAMDAGSVARAFPAPGGAQFGRRYCGR